LEKNENEFVPTTYKETKQQVHVLAAGLLKLGVETGDKIAYFRKGEMPGLSGNLPFCMQER